MLFSVGLIPQHSEINTLYFSYLFSLIRVCHVCHRCIIHLWWKDCVMYEIFLALRAHLKHNRDEASPGLFNVFRYCWLKQYGFVSVLPFARTPFRGRLHILRQRVFFYLNWIWIVHSDSMSSLQSYWFLNIFIVHFVFNQVMRFFSTHYVKVTPLASLIPKNKIVSRILLWKY
jgi:hypothetical protein